MFVILLMTNIIPRVYLKTRQGYPSWEPVSMNIVKKKGILPDFLNGGPCFSKEVPSFPRGDPVSQMRYPVSLKISSKPGSFENPHLRLTMTVLATSRVL